MNPQRALVDLNAPYPARATYVNGELHISFSGSPNRDLGQLDDVVNYLSGLKAKLSGCVYINDPESLRSNCFDVIKIVKDTVIKVQDKNFTSEETKRIFE